MKIVLVQGAFLPIPPIMGGACEKIWFRLGLQFAREGHEVTHISRSHQNLPSASQIEGVKHIRVQGYDSPASLLSLKILDLFYSLRVLKSLPADADVIVTNTFWMPILLRGETRRKVFVSVERMPKGQMRWYRPARLRANSAPVAAAICLELPVKDRHHVVTIPNPLPFDADESFDLESKRPVMLYCGRVHPEKGLQLLIQAMRVLDNPWPLRIVGPWQTDQGGGGNAYKMKLIQLAHELPVTFVGPIYEPEPLNVEYRSASVFVYPSIAEKGETFGSAPLEAMAWGCAPIVSNLDCFKDFIRNGENGLIFDHRGSDAIKKLSGAIRALTTNATLCSRLARRALHVRESHSATSIARLFLNDFKSMAAEYRR